MKNKKNSISLKKLLVLSFASLIVISGFSITIISFIGSRNLGFNMASQIMSDNASQVLGKVVNYLDSASDVNTTLAYQIDTGELDIDNPNEEKNTFQYLKHYLELYPEFVGMFYGDENGRFIYAKKLPDTSISLRVINQDEDKIYSVWNHENPFWYKNGYLNSIDSLDEGYDPRKRTWYKTARSTGKNTWSDVYVFSSDKKPGITNAQPIFKDDNYLRGVLGIDMGIVDISYYLNTLEISDKAKIVVINDKKQIIALSGDNDTLLNKLEHLTKIDEFDDAVIRGAYSHYLKTILKKQISSFSVEKERYVTTFMEFPSDSSVDWQIGIIIPENIILGDVYRTMKFILFAAIFFVLLSTVIGFKVASGVTKPLTLISQNMKKIRKFDLEGNLELDTGLIELQEISQSFDNLKNGMRSFSKYVPSKVVAQLVSMGREAVLGGEKRKLTILFSDIEGFTEISENMEPEHLVEELADYLGNLSGIIQKNSGTVDKYIGDSIMAFWNAPEEVKDHAKLACETSIKIQQYLEDFERNNPHRTFFPTRIGINTGDVLVGNIGSPERMNYTVMGDNINLGSRLESLNKYYSTAILVSEQTKKEAGNSFAYRPLDKVTVKGKTKPIILYELLGYKRYQTREEKTFCDIYTKGLYCYFDSQWNKSLGYLNECLVLKPGDVTTLKIINRIAEYKKNPPASDWNGVFIYMDK